MIESTSRAEQTIAVGETIGVQPRTHRASYMELDRRETSYMQLVSRRASYVQLVRRET